MVGKRSSKEAILAAREVREKRERRKRYESLIEEHQAVKAMRARIAPQAPAPSKPGVPKLVAQAMQDPDVATAIISIRRVRRYENRADRVVRAYQRGKGISLNEELALIREGENVERDFREAFRKMVGKMRRDSAIEAYATAEASRPDDIEVLDNLPSYLTENEWAAFKYIGMQPDEVTSFWETQVKPHLREGLRLPASEGLKKGLDALGVIAERIEDPQSPRNLVRRGIMILGSEAVDWDKFWQDFLWALLWLGFAVAVIWLAGIYAPAIILAALGIAV